MHDEEHEAALKAFGGDDEAALFPENYRFQIPEDCHWSDVRKVATNVGQAMPNALRGIEQANPHSPLGWKDRKPSAPRSLLCLNIPDSLTAFASLTDK